MRAVRKLAEADGRCSLRDAGSAWRSLSSVGELSGFCSRVLCSARAFSCAISYLGLLTSEIGGVDYRTIVLFCNGWSEVRQAVRWAGQSPGGGTFSRAMLDEGRAWAAKNKVDAGPLALLTLSFEVVRSFETKD